jgi:hypothetical protein
LFVRYTGAPDVTYRLQRATSVTGAWTDLASNTTSTLRSTATEDGPASGLIEFHETTPPPGHSCYRTVQP